MLATVQTILIHISNPLSTYWVLNSQKKSLRGSERAPKPRGWGNPGGGVDLCDIYNDHGECFSLQETIQRCSWREVKDETGFIYIRFVYPLLPASSVFHQRFSGHTLYVVAAHIIDFHTVTAQEKESGQIEDGAWFDFSLSPAHQFNNKKDLPYWSHVKRTITRLKYLAFEQDTQKRIHPLWELALPLGKGDPRFPFTGYNLPPVQWQQQFIHHMNGGKEAIDLDHIYKQYRQDIDDIVAFQTTSQIFDRTSEHDRYAALVEQNQREWREFGESLIRPQ